MAEKKRRKHSIGFKLTLLLVLFALVLCIGISAFGALNTWNSYTDFYWEKALEAAQLAASFVDGETIATYIETGETDEAYDELYKLLVEIKRASGLGYLYIFVPGEGSLTYVMDAALETDDPSLINRMGDVYEYTEFEHEYLAPDIEAGRASPEKRLAEVNIYGAGISAWAPVKDSEGNVRAMVEADTTITIVMDAVREYLITMVIVSVGIVLLGVLGMAIVTRHTVSGPLKKLTEEVGALAEGETLATYQSDIHTGDEMQTLAEAFSKMARNLDAYTKRLSAVAAERERQSTELSLATDIQASMFPKPITGSEDFGIFGMTRSAREIGGDFYDFFMIDADRLCIVTADVSGRGIPAALFMVIAKTAIKNQFLSGGSVAQNASVLNGRLFESTGTGLAISAFMGVLEISSGVLTYVNAGQPAPFVMRKGGVYEALGEQKMSPLAQMENVSYRSMELTLRQGDRLLLCTDGVTGAVNASGRTLGNESLSGILNTARMRTLGIEETVNAVCAEIEIYEDGAEREDDVTLLALDYRKGDKARAETTLDACAEAYPAAQRFLKKQLAANGLSGAFYARLSVLLEEAFMLVIARLSAREKLVLRCAVDEQTHSVELTLSFGGNGGDPTLPNTAADGDAVDYLRRSLDALEYRCEDGVNRLVLTKTP